MKLFLFTTFGDFNILKKVETLDSNKIIKKIIGSVYFKQGLTNLNAK
jgi:hypothetical protein